MAITDPDPRAARADVELRLPADGAYVSVLRTTTAALAARLDFTLDDIEDLRIAVGEACSMVLPAADLGASLDVSFFLALDRISVSVSVPSATPLAPDYEAFGWQVLETLATSTSVETSGGRFTVTFTVHSTLGAIPEADV